MNSSDVRDLEQEGLMGNINLSQAWSSSAIDAFSNARRDILIQDFKSRIERLEEVVADLLKKQKQQEVSL